jgi:hypothetical protein
MSPNKTLVETKPMPIPAIIPELDQDNDPAEDAHEIDPVEEVGLTLLDLNPRQCRFPVGTRTDGTNIFCGEQVRNIGESWCRSCRARVFYPRSKK